MIAKPFARFDHSILETVGQEHNLVFEYCREKFGNERALKYASIVEGYNGERIKSFLVKTDENTISFYSERDFYKWFKPIEPVNEAILAEAGFTWTRPREPKP